MALRQMKSEMEFRVEWGETDPAAVLFYPNFFKWFDSGTWRLLISAGFTLEVLSRDFGLIGCPIVEARSSFRHPARFWDEVRLTSFVDSWTRRTFRVVHEVRIADRLCAEGQETRVCARRAAGRDDIEAVPIPAAFRARLEAE